MDYLFVDFLFIFTEPDHAREERVLGVEGEWTKTNISQTKA